MTSRMVLRLLTVAALAAGGAMVSAQGQLLPSYPKLTFGASVSPAYDGWYDNADGTHTFLVGYYNRNWTEEVDVPIGPNNKFEPGDPDRGIPSDIEQHAVEFIGHGQAQRVAGLGPIEHDGGDTGVAGDLDGLHGASGCSQPDADTALGSICLRDHRGPAVANDMSTETALPAAGQGPGQRHMRVARVITSTRRRTAPTTPRAPRGQGVPLF